MSSLKKLFKTLSAQKGKSFSRTVLLLKLFFPSNIKQNSWVHSKDGYVHLYCRQSYISFQGRASAFIFKANENGLRRKEDDGVYHCVLFLALLCLIQAEPLTLSNSYLGTKKCLHLKPKDGNGNF